MDVKCLVIVPENEYRLNKIIMYRVNIRGVGLVLTESVEVRELQSERTQTSVSHGSPW
jgi:hypothetical protein